MGVSEGERQDRIRLGRATEPGDPRVAALLQEGYTPGEVIAAIGRGTHRWAASLRSRLAVADPAADLAAAAAVGARYVVPGDAEWPAGLDALAIAGTVVRRAGPPLGLWVRGPLDLAEATERSVAVVGSRAATAYGTEMASRLAGELATAGWTVTSGGAYGIDQAAHRGAVMSQGPSVAVLACGIDRCYPVSHERLISHLAQHGLVISEAAPGDYVTKIGFLARNRIIAGLSRGTVVVEAAVRSGALNTATWTERLHRPVLGVPGPVTSAASAGVHQLIRARDALLVTSAGEVMEAIAPIGEHAQLDPREAAQPLDAFDLDHRAVHDAARVDITLSTEDIARAVDAELDLTKRRLATLEQAGLVEQRPGGWLAIHPRRR